MPVFDKLQLWVDFAARTGPEAMAVDQWLLETTALPVLRAYRWHGHWASVGYFGEIAAARASIQEVGWVRRWTGGGTVDHRADWTYSIVVPQGEPLATLRGPEAYRVIHAALAETLSSEKITARLAGGDQSTGTALCFENPVSYDLLGPDGRKIAGAGQRRSRQGLLHQGSVAVACEDDVGFHRRANDLASRLSRTQEIFSFESDPPNLAAMIAARYKRAEWTNRR